MLFRSQAPDKLPASVRLFANMQGYDIGVSVEFSKPTGRSLQTPPERDDGDKRDDPAGDDETEDQSQTDRHWKRSSAKNKDKQAVGDGPSRNGKDPVEAMEQMFSSPQKGPCSTPEAPGKIQNRPALKLMAKSSVGSSSVPLPSIRSEERRVGKEC